MIVVKSHGLKVELIKVSADPDFFIAISECLVHVAGSDLLHVGLISGGHQLGNVLLQLGLLGFLSRVLLDGFRLQHQVIKHRGHT